MIGQSVEHIFYALADPGRLRMVERLSMGPATVKQLAVPSGMRLPSAVKHLQILEAGGIVVSKKMGRSRTYYLEPTALRTISEWTRSREASWNKAFDKLAAAMLAIPDAETESEN